MTSVARVRARRGEGEKLREEILAAVSALLDETNDEAAVSIRAIAERVGVTPPSIYRHFEDKEAMLGAVCAEVFVQLTEGIAQAVASSKSPLDALAEAGRCYVQFGLEHPEHYRLVFMRPPFKGEMVDHSELRPVLETGVIPESHPLFSGDALAGSQAFKALYDLVDAVLADVPKRRPAGRVHGDDVDVDGHARHHVTAHQQTRLRLAIRRGPGRRHHLALAGGTRAEGE